LWLGSYENGRLLGTDGGWLSGEVSVRQGRRYIEGGAGSSC
jgi:hypothetical protein